MRVCVCVAQDVLSLRAKFDDKDGGVKFVELVPDMPLAYVRCAQ